MKDFDCNSLWIATKVFLHFLGLGVLSINPCFAQSTITPDNTLGTEASQVTQNVTNPNGIKSELIEGGAQRGHNLFHSFQEFNVNEGQGAYFLVPNETIQNVLTRVTGNNPSKILGTLGTTSNRNFAPTNTNLFLINPNGVIFGKNASLDLNGSFVGTTANAVKFGRGLFSATNPQAPSELLTVNPSAFLFNRINAQASIQNNSVADVGLKPSEDFTPKGLRVPDGKSLLLVGGEIKMNGGGLVALGGRVEFGGLASAGTVGLIEDGNNLSLSFPDGVERSNVFLNNIASVVVAAGDGGSIAVTTRNLEMTQGSQLFAGIDSGQGSDNSKAGNIDVKVIEAINLKSGSFISNQVLPEASGQGGDVKINANSLLVQDGSRVDTALFGKGKGGNLNINAQDVQVIGNGLSQGVLVPSLLSSGAQQDSTGDAGNLTIHTNKLLVQDGAQVNTSTFSTGKGGDLTVEAQDVKVIGISPEGKSPSGLFTNTGKNSTGDAGNFTIHTHKLLLQDGAQVYSGTSGEGKGGGLTVEAQDVQLTGASQSKDSQQFSSGLFTETQENSTGKAGNLSIKTNTLRVQDGATVRTSTSGQGKGGNLTIEAQDVQVTGRGKVNQLRSDLSTSTLSTGDAGNMEITTSQFQILDGSGVRANTFGAGNGGNLTVNADSLRLKDNSRITAVSEGTGIAGKINLTIKNNFNADNGQVLTQAEQSSGGDITITSGKNIFLRHNSDIKTTLSTTAGNSGNITLNANAIVALEDSDILAFAPEGNGGNISFNTSAFLSDPLFRPTSQITDKATLDALDRVNNRVDVNASGEISGGTISGIPDISFLQNSLIELPENLIDTEALVASSCVVRSNKRNGTFVITGKAGLPNRPGDASPSFYSAVDVQPIPDDTSATRPSHRWKIGDPIVQPTGVYLLENGQRILSRECGK